MSDLVGMVPTSPVNPFAPESTQRRVDAMLAQLPPEHTAVIVGYYDLNGTWRAGWGYRKDTSNWGKFEFEASVGQDIARGNVSGGVYLRWVGGDK